MIYIFQILSVFCLIVNGNITTTHYRHLPKDCGKNRFESARIIDGRVAELGQFPWIARIGMTRNGQTIFYCAGSLINRYYVVTAANCKDRLSNIVRLGENYLTGSRDCSKGVCAPPHQDILINRFILHEDYCSALMVNDFAVIELTKPARLNEFVQPICFPREPLLCKDLLTSPAYVAGWGLENTNPDKSPDYLMYFLAPAIDQEVCNHIYLTHLKENQICMGYMKGKDTCDGDSGGPVSKLMTTHGGQKRYVLRAVVSYGLATCGKGPAVYTDASHFADWIMDVVYKS